MGINSIRCVIFQSFCLFFFPYDIGCKLAEWVYSSFQMRRTAFGSDVPGIKGSFSNALSQTKANSIFMHCFHSKSYHDVVENFILKAITNTFICTANFTRTHNIMINVVTPLNISRNKLIKFVPITGTREPIQSCENL